MEMVGFSSLFIVILRALVLLVLGVLVGGIWLVTRDRRRMR
jgi:flagellar basal body-associated protein FliL